MRERLRSMLPTMDTKDQKKGRGKQVDAVAAPTAVPVLGALNTNSPSDESVPMDISSDSEVESDITPMAGEVFSVDWEAKVRAV